MTTGTSPNVVSEQNKKLNCSTLGCLNMRVHKIVVLKCCWKEVRMTVCPSDLYCWREGQWLVFHWSQPPAVWNPTLVFFEAATFTGLWIQMIIRSVFLPGLMHVYLNLYLLRMLRCRKGLHSSQPEDVPLTLGQIFCLSIKIRFLYHAWRCVCVRVCTRKREFILTEWLWKPLLENHSSSTKSVQRFGSSDLIYLWVELKSRQLNKHQN